METYEKEKKYYRVSSSLMSCKSSMEHMRLEIYEYILVGESQFLEPYSQFCGIDSFFLGKASLFLVHESLKLE